MLETRVKQETNFWQGGNAVLESFHRSAMTAGGAAARTMQARQVTESLSISSPPSPDS